MNTLSGMLLFLAGSFVLIIVFVKTPAIQYYTGGVIIGLFMLGIFLAAGNAALGAKRLEEAEKRQSQPAASSDSTSAPAPSTSH